MVAGSGISKTVLSAVWKSDKLIRSLPELFTSSAWFRAKVRISVAEAMSAALKQAAVRRSSWKVPHLPFFGLFAAPPQRVLLFAGVAESIFLSQSTPVISEKQREGLREGMILDIKRSILKLREGLFKEAEDILHIALGVARQIEDPRGEVYILDMLANIYFEEKRYDLAEATFKDVLRRELQSGKPENTEGIIEVSAKLARLYAEQGQVDKAKSGFDFCFSHLDKKLGELEDDNKEQVVDLFLKVLQWGSEFLLGVEDKTEASLETVTTMMENGLKRARELEHTGSEAYQTLSNNLSTLYTWQNRIEDAVVVMKETIKLALASGHWSLAHFYMNLAHIYAENNDYLNAEATAAKALEIATRTKDVEVIEEVKRLRDDIKRTH